MYEDAIARALASPDNPAPSGGMPLQSRLLGGRAVFDIEPNRHPRSIEEGNKSG